MAFWMSLVATIVAYEDRTGLPATNLHSDRLWHTGVNQITGTRTTQIVNEQFGALRGYGR
jgi:hypothetical protein